MAGALTFIETDDANATTIQAQLYNTLPISGGITGQNRPVTAMTVLDDGRLVAGIYYISFSSVSPGVSGVAVISASDPNNPWVTNAIGVTLDDDQTTSGTGTAHDNIIGGLRLYFSESASFATSWTAKIIVGGYFSSSGVATPIASFGTLAAGATSSQKKLGIKNTGDADCTDCVLGIYPGTYFKNITGTPIDKVKVISKSATEGKYALTTTNYNGVPTPHECDVYVARYTYNYTTSAWDLASASSLKGTFGITGTSQHTTIITGMEITLDTSISGNTAANIYIESSSGAQIAPDISGTPGSWVSSSDVVLTESGGVTGTIQDGNTAYAWLRIVSSSSDKPGNVRKFTLRPSGSSLGSLVE